MITTIRKIIRFVFLFVFLAVSVVSFKLPVTVFASHLPNPFGYVNDFAQVLHTDQKQTLENNLQAYEKQTGNEIAIVLISSLKGDAIENFTAKAFEEWKIGKKNKDNGILILAAINDRKIRIEVGYSLEPFVTDGEAGQIIREVIAPEFKRSDYYSGLSLGIKALQDQISGKPTENIKTFDPLTTFEKIEIFFGVLWIVFLFGSFLVYLSSFLARSKSIWAGGLIGALVGVILGLIFYSLVIFLVSAVILGLLGLIFDWLLSNVYRNLKRENMPTDWWHTGGGFWGGRLGGGFGGFGGGSSGGGGASGSW